MDKRYWLFKSDPETFSFDDLAKAPKKTSCWDGVRNYQARNMLRDEISVGDGVLFHHSSADPPAVFGTAVIVRAGYPEPSQFDPRSPNHDPKSTRKDPRWFAVDIRLERRFATAVSIEQLRAARGTEGMVLLKKGSRLSIQPVTASEWKIVLRLGGAPD